MATVTTLKNIITDVVKGDFAASSREANLPSDANKVISLLGPRRSGKMWVLFNMMATLKELFRKNRKSTSCLPFQEYMVSKSLDFLVEDRHLINVAYDLATPVTRQRELGGLAEAGAALGMKTATLVSQDVEEVVVQNGKEMQVLPLWKWLLTFEPGD